MSSFKYFEQCMVLWGTHGNSKGSPIAFVYIEVTKLSFIHHKIRSLSDEGSNESLGPRKN